MKTSFDPPQKLITKNLSLNEIRKIKSLWPTVPNNGLLFNITTLRSIGLGPKVPDLNDDNNNFDDEDIKSKDPAASEVTKEEAAADQDVEFTIDAGPLNVDWMSSHIHELSGLADDSLLEDAYMMIDDVSERMDHNKFSSDEPINCVSLTTWENDTSEEIVNAEDVVSVDHIENFSLSQNTSTDKEMLGSQKVAKPKKRKRKCWF